MNKILKILGKFNPFYIVPIILAGNALHTAHQMWYAMVVQHQHDTPLVTSYLAALIASGCMMLYFFMYATANSAKSKAEKEFMDQQMKLWEFSAQVNNLKVEEERLKKKVAIYEKRYGLPRSEGVEVETPISSLADVLDSQLTKD